MRCNMRSWLLHRSRRVRVRALRERQLLALRRQRVLALHRRGQLGLDLGRHDRDGLRLRVQCGL